MKKLLLAAAAVIALTTASNACSPALHCILKYGVTKQDCRYLVKQGSLRQQVESNMTYEEDNKGDLKPADLDEYSNIPKVQAACKKLGINLKS
jgi:hypothetical protein